MDLKNKNIEDRRNILSKRKVISLKGEKWVDIPNYEGSYKISNFFRVKSICRVVKKSDGHTVIKPEQLISLHKNTDGYFIFSMTKETIGKTYSLHVLMAKIFVPNPFNLPEVNHKDGDKSNCLPSNLEWGTRKYNMRHAVKNGLRKYDGVDSKKRNFDESEIVQIYHSKDLSGVLAKKYNVTKSSIQRIRSGKTYSNITNGLDK